MQLPEHLLVWHGDEGEMVLEGEDEAWELEGKMSKRLMDVDPSFSSMAFKNKASICSSLPFVAKFHQKIA